MITRREASTGLLFSAVLAAAPRLAAENATAIDLPPPRADGGKPLIQALRLRRSIREYSPQPLPKQVLSDLLWAAFGVNRPASGDRTAPYWRHVMVIDVYAAMEDGVWLYEPKTPCIAAASADDIRTATGLQDFVGTAPLNLVYVAHGERMQDISAEESAPLCVGRYRLYRTERLLLLRLRRAGDRLSRCGRLRQAWSHDEAQRRAVRHLCPDGRISARVK